MYNTTEKQIMLNLLVGFTEKSRVSYSASSAEFIINIMLAKQF